MRGFRSIRRFGAALGLFALLLQLALTFAHIHPEDIFPSASGASAQVADRSQPGGRDPDRQAPGAPHDDCPTCTVMHLAGTVVVPDAPALAVPLFVRHVLDGFVLYGPHVNGEAFDHIEVSLLEQLAPVV